MSERRHLRLVQGTGTPEPLHRCDHCGKPTNNVWQVPVERNGVLEADLVGRDCMEKMRAQGYDNAQMLSPAELRAIKAQGGSSWRPMTIDKWWQFGDAVVGSDGAGVGGRQDWECYERGRLVAIKHSIAEARAYFEDRYGPLPWNQADLTPVKYDHPYFGTTEEFTAPTRVWYVEHLPG